MNEFRMKPIHVAVATIVALEELRAAMAPVPHPPHAFKGRRDRWCEVCNRPDRHPVHAVATTEAKP